MFGKRSATSEQPRPARPAPEAAEAPAKAPASPPPAAAALPPAPQAPPQLSKPIVRVADARSDEYYQIKTTIFNALIDTIDLAQLAQLDPESAREEIRDIVNEIISIKAVVMSIAEQESLLQDICNDVLGYGPLEPLLARDDIADIMVNGANRVFIEVSGKIQLTNIRFRDNAQLMNICQRIVSQVGRRVDEASPICDARLLDGSRVNVIAPPLSLDGPTLTIRKFRKDKLTLDDLVNFGSISPGRRARAAASSAAARCNVLISGGTGSGKTTLLNCMTAYHRRRRARHHLRGRGRTAAAAAACRAAGNPPAQSRRPGHDHHARPGQELSAYAPRTHHRGRSARTRSVRPAAGHEHRP